MKKHVSLLCLVCAMFGPAIGVKAQNPQLTNHYAMKLVECEQSKLFAEAVKQKGGKTVLDIYPFYDHNLSSKSSDKMEEIFFKSVDFI